MIQEAFRIAVEFMTPVIFLSDGYIGNGAEPWLIPQLKDLKPIQIKHPAGHKPGANGSNGSNGNGNGANGEPEPYLPYKRDERLTRPWAIPGTPGLEHRLGGLEKSDVTGNIDYSPANHEHMVKTRAKKVANIADAIPLLSWGGTYGAVRTAVRQAIAEGKSVAHAHLRYLSPFPKNLESIVRSYEKVLIPELNMGQLRFLIRGNFVIDAAGLNKIQGKPFLVNEIVERINAMLEGQA
jgi:2-oxoglutarate ferredoxin oxidoreductase subunit alpha